MSKSTHKSRPPKSQHKPQTVVATSPSLVIQKPLVERYAWYLVAVMTFLALVSRLYRLDAYSLWVDEYVHAMNTRQFLYHHGSWIGMELNQFVVNVLDYLFVFLFGYSDFVLRLPVALFSVIGIPAIYVLGKKMFSASVGLLSALLFLCSPFLTFWGRIDRAYGLIPAFYLVLLVLFYKMLNAYRPEKKTSAFFRYAAWDQTTFYYLLLVFVVCILTQIQTFLFVFSVGFYYLFCFVSDLFSKQVPTRWTNMTAVMAYLTIATVLLLFTPLSDLVLKPLVYQFLPAKMVDLIVPNVETILAPLHTPQWNKSFLMYWRLTVSDLSSFYILGWLGFLLNFFSPQKKKNFFLLAFFVIPFLLMSFVFREPNWAKYMSFYYPLFFVSGISGYGSFFDYLQSRFLMGTRLLYFRRMLLFVLLYVFIPTSDLHHLLTTEDTHLLVKKELSEIAFLPWKENVEYVTNRMQKGDVVLSVVTDPVVHYTNNDSLQIIHFRQKQLNGKTRLFEPIQLDSTFAYKDHAYSYEGLVNLYNKYPRGWLITNHYLLQPPTDPRARQFVYEHMVYHFNQNKDGSMGVFSWDKTKPPTHPTHLLMEYGKVFNAFMPKDTIFFTITKQQYTTYKKAIFTFVCEGIDEPAEAIIALNLKYPLSLSVATNTLNMNGIKVYPSVSRGVELVEVSVPINWLQVGNNRLDINNADSSNGFAFYDVQLRFE